ncbi:MAG: hypothetical protein ACRDMH_06540 [Solirubrobacterales bacterium]
MVEGNGQVNAAAGSPTLCASTRLPIPECSCRTCLEAQLQRHAPHLIEHGGFDPGVAQDTGASRG